MTNPERATSNTGFKFSAVWLIPVLALALGLFLVVQSWLTEGPEIEISLSTASGLEQGKTKIKFRNVELGVVTEVRLDDDFHNVIATAKLSRQALPLLLNDTEFWLVTARVGVGSISGLDTLLSGAYIQLAPGKGEIGARSFTALETPPLTPAGAPGLRLQLTSEDNTASVSPGDSVLYKGFKVGQVESKTFDPNDGFVRYDVFIDAPYHELVDSSVRFWDISGFSVSAGADGFKIETGSVDTVLIGGVAFELPEGVQPGEPVNNGTQFQIYNSHEEISENPYEFGTYFVVRFEQSIKGLLLGAPVEYRGIPVGRVERILLKESLIEAKSANWKGRGQPIPVLIYIEPGRLELPDEKASVDNLRRTIITGVTRGLRSSLENGNLLTGAKYIGIDYFSSVEPAEVSQFLDYTVIPSIETGLGQMQQKMVAILDKINAMPLDVTIANFNGAVGSLDDTLVELKTLLGQEESRDLPGELGGALSELRELLNGLSPGSHTYESIDSSLLRLNRAMSNLESLTEKLADQPNSLILPLSSADDPEPEAPK